MYSCPRSNCSVYFYSWNLSFSVIISSLATSTSYSYTISTYNSFTTMLRGLRSVKCWTIIMYEVDITNLQNESFGLLRVSYFARISSLPWCHTDASGWSRSHSCSCPTHRRNSCCHVGAGILTATSSKAAACQDKRPLYKWLTLTLWRVAGSLITKNLFKATSW